MNPVRLVFLAPERDEASPYLIVEEDEIIVRGQLMPDAVAILPPLRTVLVVPGASVLARWIELPACTQAQATAAASLLLKDEIAAAKDSVHLAVGSAAADGFRLVCVVDRVLMQSFIERAAALGISPDLVVPDQLMLPAPEDDALLVAMFGGMATVRGKHVAFSAEPELARLLIGARPVQMFERADEIERCFAASASQPIINLRQQDFAPASTGQFRWKNLRRAAVLASVAALSPLALWTAEIAKDEFSARALETRAATAARTVSSGAGDPVLNVRGRLADLRASDRFLRSTAGLFEGLAQLNGAELDSLSYLEEGVIRATLVGANEEGVAALTRTLEQSHIALEHDAPTGPPGRSTTTITLKPLP